MIWLFLSAGLAANVDWRRLLILGGAMHWPLPALGLVAFHVWRNRPDRSMRGPVFCDAVANEIRAGASIRQALETAARSVDAEPVLVACREGASMLEVAAAAGNEFTEIGIELRTLISRAHNLGVTPASLFDELGSLGLAKVQVQQEVAAASAPAKAAATVLLAVPAIALFLALARGGLSPYLARPEQRGAVLIGLVLTLAGLVSAVALLRRGR